MMMKRSDLSRLTPLAMLGALTFLAAAKDAEAYIDPGSGSVILQALIAAALGAWIVIKIGWKRTHGFVRDFFKRKDKDVA